MYSKIPITADVILDEIPAPSGKAVMAFSGGLDAMFSLLRHELGSAGWRCQDVTALALVHGFDVPLADGPAFEKAYERAAKVARAFDLEIFRVVTNFRALDQNWEDAFAAGVASCLLLFSDTHSLGILASGKSYDQLKFPWGSNPVTDHLLSTGRQSVMLDGTGANRTRKARLIASEPSHIRNLRVCWQGEAFDGNCGVCEKCVRTYWNFRIAGVREPACFPSVTRSPWRVRVTGSLRIEWESILREARESSHRDAGNFAHIVLAQNSVRDQILRVPGARVVGRALRALSLTAVRATRARILTRPTYGAGD